MKTYKKIYKKDGRNLRHTTIVAHGFKGVSINDIGEGISKNCEDIEECKKYVENFFKNAIKKKFYEEIKKENIEENIFDRINSKIISELDNS